MKTIFTIGASPWVAFIVGGLVALSFFVRFAG